MIAKAKSQLDVNKIVLFGSRARDDFKHGSDIDLAFYYPESQASRWARFAVEVSEDMNTLITFDLVDARTANQDLSDSISKEGITIFEKK